MLVITPFINEALIRKAKELDPSGIIVIEREYSFLKINDEYIHELYDLLDKKLNIRKPNYFLSPKSMGAHITVIYPEENVVLQSEDAGQQHTFSIKDLCLVTLDTKKYFVLLVSAPSLAQLRKKYHLAQKPCYKGHAIDFHITIAHALL